MEMERRLQALEAEQLDNIDADPQDRTEAEIKLAADLEALTHQFTQLTQQICPAIDARIAQVLIPAQQTSAGLAAMNSGSGAVPPSGPPPPPMAVGPNPTAVARDTDAPPTESDYQAPSRHPVNPKLPAYDGSTDPGLWLRQVDVLFSVNETPVAQQGSWMISALKGAAMRFWHLECSQQPRNAGTVAAKMKERFRPFAHEFGVDSQITNLRMHPGGYVPFQERWNELSAQLRSKSSTDLIYTFLRGLTQEYRAFCITNGATDVRHAQELCRRMDLAARSSAPTALAASMTRERRQFTSNRSRDEGRSARSPSFRGRSPGRAQSPFRTTSPFARGPPRNQSWGANRQSRSPSQRPWRSTASPRPPSGRGPSPFARPQSAGCFNCGKPGHRAAECRAPKQTKVAFDAPKPSPGRGGYGRGRGGGRSGSGRGPPRPAENTGR